MTANHPIETDRLALRKFTPADAPFILRLLNEPSFLENIGDKGVRTEQQAVRYLVDGPIRSYALHGHGLYLVALKQSQLSIGMCGILRREGISDVDLGYAFLPEHWSSGYAFESATAVLSAEGARFPRILAFVSPGNTPSIRLLERLGFAFAGHTKLTPDAPDVEVYERPSRPRSAR